MHAVLLDADSLGPDIDLAPLKECTTSLTVHSHTLPDEVTERLKDADIALVNKVVLDKSVIDACPHLKLICVLATGTNNIDMSAANAAEIPVRNVENYGKPSITQHVMALMLALATRLVLQQRDLSHGEWQKSRFFTRFERPATQLSGKHLAIVGQGELGSEVGRLAEAFGMHVTFCARPGSTDDSRPTLKEMLPHSDVVSLHCPLNEHTRGLINSDALSLMKPGAFLINCARGGIIDEQAALDALRNGQLGGLAIDTLPEEPPRHGHALLDALNEDINLLITPHSAWIALEARQKIIDLTADNIRTSIQR